MRLLLDTHALLWWTSGSNRFPVKLRELILNPSIEVLVSAVSAMEITTKFRIGKLPEAALLALDFERHVAAENFQQLDISVEHAALAGSLDIAHKDPFDRLLIAQARLTNLTLVSNERIFDTFAVKRIW